MQCGLFYLSSSDWSIFNKRGVNCLLLLPYFIEIPVFYANSVDPYQTPRSPSVASDLGLHCLPMSLLWDARHNYKILSGSNSFYSRPVFLFVLLLEDCSSQSAFYVNLYRAVIGPSG